MDIKILVVDRHKNVSELKVGDKFPPPPSWYIDLLPPNSKLTNMWFEIRITIYCRIAGFPDSKSSSKQTYNCQKNLTVLIYLEFAYFNIDFNEFLSWLCSLVYNRTLLVVLCKPRGSWFSMYSCYVLSCCCISTQCIFSFSIWCFMFYKKSNDYICMEINAW